MKLEDIRHRATLKSIETYNIDVSPFENIEQVRKYVKSVKSKKYRQNNMEYFRNYMYERSKAIELLKELPLC